MNIAIFLKDNLKNIPPGIGQLINYLPYSYRPGIGKIYRQRRAEINTYNSLSSDEKKDFILTRMKFITDYAYRNILFYKKLYDEHSFHPSQIKYFDDLSLIPIVSKSILNEVDIENRSINTPHRYIVNTGGSSGTPFSLYIEPTSIGHEWAHMHHVWGKLGYKPHDLKLVFAGRSDLKRPVEYDPLRNHFAIDIYADYKIVASYLKKILKKYPVKFLHGYPSSIYDFAIFCKEHDKELLHLLSRHLKGAFLSSEYPHPLYRETIESTFNIPTISWYGHTERTVLSYEKNQPFTYEPFTTYGFAECIPSENHDEFQLISTSYYNFASPMIRYNTNDIISDVIKEDGLMESFKITKGREGEHIFDKKNKKINLTGLIFGRHHELFNYSTFIQVRQVQTGAIEIHFVSDSVNEDNAHNLFDNRNLDLDISFVKRQEPHRTQAGKVNLLIKT